MSLRAPLVADFEKYLSPEARFLLACAVADPEEQAPGRGPEVPDSPDWEFLLESATWHAVDPLLHRALAKLDSPRVPTWVRERVETRFYSSAFHSLKMARELARVVELFESHGLRPIALKGPVLARMAYGQVAMRQFSDVDVLVPRRDLDEARRLLVTDGYRFLKEHKGRPAPDRFKRSTEEFAKPSGDTLIDLHWEISPWFLPYEPNPDALLERIIRVDLDGVAVASLSVEDVLLFACVHGAKHGWGRLGWICDLANLVRRWPGIDWKAVCAMAAATGSRRMLALGLYLAHEVARARVPEALLGEAARDTGLRRLCRGIMGRLFSRVRHKANLFQDWLVPLAALEGFTGRVRYVVGRAVLPTFEDWMVLPVERPFYPLYFAIRPLRLAFEQGPRLFRPVPEARERSVAPSAGCGIARSAGDGEETP